jgi:hypothetical protein
MNTAKPSQHPTTIATRVTIAPFQRTRAELMISHPLPEMVRVPGAEAHLIGLAAVGYVHSTTLVSPVKRASRIVASPSVRATPPAHMPRFIVTLASPRMLAA